MKSLYLSPLEKGFRILRRYQILKSPGDEVHVESLWVEEQSV